MSELEEREEELLIDIEGTTKKVIGCFKARKFHAASALLSSLAADLKKFAEDHTLALAEKVMDQ